jgi:hypothetical protein
VRAAQKGDTKKAGCRGASACDGGRFMAETAVAAKAMDSPSPGRCYRPICKRRLRSIQTRKARYSAGPISSKVIIQGAVAIPALFLFNPLT